MSLASDKRTENKRCDCFYGATVSAVSYSVGRWSTCTVYLELRKRVLFCRVWPATWAGRGLRSSSLRAPIIGHIKKHDLITVKSVPHDVVLRITISIYTYLVFVGHLDSMLMLMTRSCKLWANKHGLRVQIKKLVNFMTGLSIIIHNCRWGKNLYK